MLSFQLVVLLSVSLGSLLIQGCTDTAGVTLGGKSCAEFLASSLGKSACGWTLVSQHCCASKAKHCGGAGSNPSLNVPVNDGMAPANPINPVMNPQLGGCTDTNGVTFGGKNCAQFLSGSMGQSACSWDLVNKHCCASKAKYCGGASRQPTNQMNPIAPISSGQFPTNQLNPISSGQFPTNQMNPISSGQFPTNQMNPISSGQYPTNQMNPMMNAGRYPTNQINPMMNSGRYPTNQMNPMMNSGRYPTNQMNPMMNSGRYPTNQMNPMMNSGQYPTNQMNPMMNSGRYPTNQMNPMMNAGRYPTNQMNPMMNSGRYPTNQMNPMMNPMIG